VTPIISPYCPGCRQLPESVDGFTAFCHTDGCDVLAWDMDQNPHVYLEHTALAAIGLADMPSAPRQPRIRPAEISTDPIAWGRHNENTRPPTAPDTGHQRAHRGP
jgi:hypothetical protein